MSCAEGCSRQVCLLGSLRLGPTRCPLSSLLLAGVLPSAHARTLLHISTTTPLLVGYPHAWRPLPESDMGIGLVTSSCWDPTSMYPECAPDCAAAYPSARSRSTAAEHGAPSFLQRMEESGSNVCYGPSGLPAGQLSGKIYLPGMLLTATPVLPCALVSTDEGPAHPAARFATQACAVHAFQDGPCTELRRGLKVLRIV